MGRYESRTAVKSRPRVHRWVILPVLLLLIIGAGVFWFVWQANEFSLTLDLKGDSEIVLEYGEEFQDPGATASFSGTLLLRIPRHISVVTEGEVDATKLGTYELTYHADMELDLLGKKIPFTASRTRTVTIVDTQAPEILLETKEGAFTVPGEPYQEEGFSARDNYDGDLTAQVVRQEADGKVTYSVTDSAGNTAQAVRDIYYYDPVAPEISLLGMEKITISQGIDFVDPGCTALDNGDGDISSQVTLNSDLNTDVPGTYTLTYSVTDSYGNTASVTRQVTVKELTHANVTKPEVDENKIIYLTFDDGPGGYTAQLLDVLDKYDVKATFFVVHHKSMEILSRAAASGHKVAMHSYTHDYRKIYTSQEDYFEDMTQIQDEIFKYTGQKSKLLRFPGGGSNTISRHYCKGIMSALASALKNEGYAYTDWNVDSNDAGGAKTAEEVYNNVIGGISGRKKAIVLQHDIKGFSVEAVEKIIQWGISHGYTFRAMTDEGPVYHQHINN